MKKITIDNKVYDLDKLSDDVKKELQMVQATDKRIAELNLELAIAQTARFSYARAVEALLKESSAGSKTSNLN